MARASPLAFNFYTMFKKILTERMVHYNDIMRHATNKMKLYPPESPNYQIARNTILQAEACIAEIIIIQNKISLLNFLRK